MLNQTGVCVRSQARPKAPPQSRGPRPTGPYGANARGFEQRAESDPEFIGQPHQASHREVLHSELDSLQVVGLEPEPFRKRFLSPTVLPSQLGHAAADVLERTFRIELSHAQTVDLPCRLKHCVV